jgi:hypothetical protein
MQNVQVLLQPTETETHAENAESRLTGNVDGKCSQELRRCITDSKLFGAFY